MDGIYLGELVGTAVMILFGGGVVATVVLNRSKGAGGGWVVIAFGWGFAVTIGIYASIGMGGIAHLNPAVTLGQAINGGIAWSALPGLVVMQFLGAMVGALLVWLVYLGHFRVTEDVVAKRDIFCTTPQINNYVGNYLTEIIGTAVLLFGILAINVTPFSDGLNPIMIGFLITAIGFSLGGPTGYAINPARDLGPRIMHALLPISGKGDSNWKYALVPLLGPLSGSIIGTGLYRVFYTDGGGAIWVIGGLITALLLLVFGQFSNRHYLKDQVEPLI